MTSISARIIDAFRNLRSDSVPRPPRSETRTTSDDVTEEQADNENETMDHNEEDTESDDLKKEGSPKFKSFFGTNKNKEKFKNAEKNKKPFTANNVNTQATGNVINIIGSSNVQWGSKYVYYLESMDGQKKTTKQPEQEEEYIEKTNEITLLMEAEITPEHEYVDYIAKNLGKSWHSFFKRLGYSQGRIETYEIDESKNGVSEARYKLLLDWIRNDDIGTLGRLAVLLWEGGERQIVKELSVMFIGNKKH